jgi:hypothetical protein
MGNVRRWVFALTLTTSLATSYAQDLDSLLVKATLSSQDTLSIVDLIDSLLMLDDGLESQLAFRVGYNSNVLEAGRTLGIQNFGLSPAISYYHKSGFYADLTGYWSKDFDPAYYLTVASLGYMYTFSKYLSFMANYDRYFYASSSSYIPYQNTFSLTPVIDVKPFSLTLNYSYYFGDQVAHRLMPGLGVRIEKKKLWKFDRVALLPSFYVLFGDATITTIDYVPPTTREEFIQARRNFRDFRVYGVAKQTDEHLFGVMNYTISVPLSVTYKSWSLMLTYAYNIPKALDGEPLTISESSFISGSLTYYISFNPNKKRL